MMAIPAIALAALPPVLSTAAGISFTVVMKPLLGIAAYTGCIKGTLTAATVVVGSWALGYTVSRVVEKNIKEGLEELDNQLEDIKLALKKG